jgi:ABC-type polysaccharide/polyol phosphate transport system ATPase subunit
MSLVIKAESISKRFTVGTVEPFATLRDSVARALTAPLAFLSKQRQEPGTLWALRDVSFDVHHGDVVGIIGRNGCGKSTLLKILSRITEPTSGRAVVRGRVGSLLEVGTGFHHELSGRENVFVNGAILGMRRREIQRKFDEIVAFAGVARFIDTPVKRYSSGMQMRLAFAVAAHLDPTILLVDEVLAVGDMEFQRRCLGKMEEVSREGRTIILVSHQMGQIRRLCHSTLWLDQGQVRAFGRTADTIRAYETALATGAESGGSHCFAKWEIPDIGHTLRDSTEPFVIRVSLNLRHALSKGYFSLCVLDDEDSVLAGWAFEPLELPAGPQSLDVTVDSLPLVPRNYRLSLALFENGNNLTGGRVVEKWIATPYLTLDTPSLGHPQDESAGVLNVGASLTQRDALGQRHLSERLVAERV